MKYEPTQTGALTPGSGLLDKLVAQAATDGAVLMGALITAARATLQIRENSVKDLRERDALIASSKLLYSCERDLRAAYPKALLRVFHDPALSKPGTNLNTTAVNFDDLELMDEVQVQSSVVMARTLQTVSLAAEASLADFNTLVCGALGLKSVRLESNPLRAELYVAALQDVVEQQSAPYSVKLDWIAVMGAVLGEELRKMYVAGSKSLREQGVVPAGYTVRKNLGSGSRRALFELADAPRQDANAATGNEARDDESGKTAGSVVTQKSTIATHENLLTLDKLRRLLAGERFVEQELELPQRARFEQEFAERFERQPSPQAAPTTDFQSTVPAAFEALQEMRQVDQVMRSLEQRSHGDKASASDAPLSSGPSNPLSLLEIRKSLAPGARGIAQALSLEVVRLMIHNIANDPRLLAPVQSLVLRLEPAYAKLALVDARFFTDKQHLARVLLQEVTHSSLAYESTDATGFQAYLGELAAALAALDHAPIESVVPFGQVLDVLRAGWERSVAASARARTEAVDILQHIENRNVLAEKIGRDIRAHKDAGSVSVAVIEFLCGPWAQVVAQARLAGAAKVANADKYQALISALLWSVHPELNRKNIAKLTKLIPLLLMTLREGLDTIHYPSTKSAAFLEALMAIHQLAFKAADVGGDVVQPNPAPDVEPATPVLDDDPWVGPQEARASNFVDLSELPAQTTPSAASSVVFADEIPLGSWVEMRVGGEWVRTQLTWASPHGTLYLFTNAIGFSQSMTRRSRDKLRAAGQLRLISTGSVVDGALNAVAQTALRNSVDGTN